MATQETLPTLAEQARVVAARELRHPSLSGVLVDLAEASPLPRVARVRFGFQKVLRGWSLGTRLKSCRVDVTLEPRAVVMSSVGTYGREQEQFRQLASSGIGFPPPALDLRELRLEATDVLRWLGDRPLLGTTLGLGDVQLSIVVREGRLAWRVVQEVDAVGLRTIFLDARNGDVLFEQIHRNMAPS